MNRHDYQGRISRVQALMEEQNIDMLLLSLGADLPYFSGYEAMPSERLTMLAVPLEGPARLVIPALEAMRVQPQPDVFEIVTWGETDDPAALVAERAGRAQVAAIDDQTWAGVLLQLQRLMPACRFVEATSLVRELRMRKDPTEIAALREVAHAADRCAARLAQMSFAGRAELEVSGELRSMLLEEGHDTADFAIVASGPNAASPHHEPGDRKIAPGDGLVLDFGGRMAGYSSDTTRTFHVEEPSDEFREAFEVLYRAQTEAVDAVRPGVAAEAVDQAAREVIGSAGYGEYFIHRTGHGIGLEVHEHPYIVEGNDISLEPGMAFSVEPGIYLPGRFGMRIEDIVVVTDSGVERLNQSPRELKIVS